MHNAAYVSHFEAAVTQFLAAQDLSQFFQPEGRQVFLVRKIEVQYLAPCHFDEPILIETRLSNVGRSSLGFTPLMRGQDGQDKAQAEIIWVCFDKEAAQTVEIPADLRAKLTPHLS